MPQALLMLGSCYTELGRTKEAKAQFDQVLKNDPQSIPGLIGMANILLEEGQTEDVVTLCKRTLSVDPRNSQAYALLGEVYIGRQQPVQALPHLEKAVEIQPKITQNRLNLAACADRGETTRAGAADARRRSCANIRDFPAPGSTRACSTTSSGRPRTRGRRTSPKWRTIRTASRRASILARY